MATADPRRGYILGLSAYIIWGLFPLYFKAIQSVPALEIIVHRAIWSALFGAALLLVWIREKTRSVLLPILLHNFANSISLML